MLKARLVPTQLAPDTNVQAFKQTLQLGRSILCQERTRSRGKACRYAKHIRSRGFSTGYQEGLAAAQVECTATLRALRICYEDAISAALDDVQALATAIAERVIDSALLARPEVLSAWIQESLQMLKSSRKLRLSFQPRYAGIMQQVMPNLPDGITAHADATLSDADFILNGENGGVQFSWREVLSDLQLSCSQGTR